MIQNETNRQNSGPQQVILQRYLADQWTADHYTNEQRSEILLDQFKRQVATDLKLLSIEVSK